MYTIGRRRWPALFLLLLLLLRPAAARAAVELWPSVVVSSTLKYSERASLGSDPVYASRAAAVFHTSTHSKQRHTRRAADIIIAGGAPPCLLARRRCRPLLLLRPLAGWLQHGHAGAIIAGWHGMAAATVGDCTPRPFFRKLLSAAGFRSVRTAGIPFTTMMVRCQHCPPMSKGRR
jgi:hypothetical protein